MRTGGRKTSQTLPRRREKGRRPIETEPQKGPSPNQSIINRHLRYNRGEGTKEGIRPSPGIPRTLRERPATRQAPIACTDSTSSASPKGRWHLQTDTLDKKIRIHIKKALESLEHKSHTQIEESTVYGIPTLTYIHSSVNDNTSVNRTTTSMEQNPSPFSSLSRRSLRSKPPAFILEGKCYHKKGSKGSSMTRDASNQVPTTTFYSIAHKL